MEDQTRYDEYEDLMDYEEDTEDFSIYDNLRAQMKDQLEVKISKDETTDEKNDVINSPIALQRKNAAIFMSIRNKSLYG